MLMIKTAKFWCSISVGLMMAVSSPALAQAGNADEGKKIFSTKCATCHGPDGSGNTSVGKSLKAADLRSADVQKKADTDFYTQVDQGKGKMPGFGRVLNKTQINDVVAYVRQIGGKPAGKKP
jgi:mono/diheme cytochrome c family protein